MHRLVAVDLCGCRSHTGRVIFDVLVGVGIVFVLLTTVVVGLRRRASARGSEQSPEYGPRLRRRNPESDADASLRNPEATVADVRAELKVGTDDAAGRDDVAEPEVRS